jgi:hypothetical protein
MAWWLLKYRISLDGVVLTEVQDEFHGVVLTEVQDTS